MCSKKFDIGTTNLFKKNVTLHLTFDKNLEEL